MSSILYASELRVINVLNFSWFFAVLGFSGGVGVRDEWVSG